MEYTGKLNLTMLTDFYELTMANGYFKMGLRKRSRILTCFSAGSRMEAALSSWPALHKWWSI